MPTGYEVQMYTHIGSIARALERIAVCLEAQEKRAREKAERAEQDHQHLLNEAAEARKLLDD